MSFLKGDQPQAPNPIATAAAQTGTNVSTGVANAFLNNINQSTPQGSLNYDVTGNYPWTDPSTGFQYNIPTFTATQTLNPAQQQILDQSNASKFNLASLGNTESQQLLNFLPQTFNPLGTAPQAGDANNLGLVGRPTYGYNVRDPSMGIRDFGSLGGIQASYGDNAGVLQDRANVENALFQRIQPQTDRDLANLQAHLADQGIKYGSPAYQAAMDNYNRQLNDLRLGITAQGGQEQQLQENILQNQAQFANAAQQQQYQQLLGQANLYNSAAQQYNQSNATAASFYNNAQQQALQWQAQLFDAMNQQRNQYLSEQYASRNQPINEISALLSGSQISAPNFVNTPTNKIATTDIGQLVNQSFQDSLNLYKQNSTNTNQILGGLFSLAGSGLVASDIRVKENVHKLGRVFTDTPQKLAELPIYEYSYKGDPDETRHVGPMAQDVEKVDPGAVAEDRHGTKYIDSGRVLGGIMRAA